MFVLFAEDTITWKSHQLFQNEETWTYISEPIRAFEKEIQVGLAADAEVHIALMVEKDDEANAYEFGKHYTVILI